MNRVWEILRDLFLEMSRVAWARCARDYGENGIRTSGHWVQKVVTCVVQFAIAMRQHLDLHLLFFKKNLNLIKFKF